MRTRRVVIAFAAASLVLAACGESGSGSGSSDETIKIGKLSPTTSGTLALVGKQQENGAKLAVEHINANGGIKSMGGRKLELLLGDTQGEPEIGGKEAERLMDDGAVALVGALQSAVGLVTTQLAARRGIPHVIDEGVSDEITARGLDNVFRVTFSMDRQNSLAVAWLEDWEELTGHPIETIAVMHEDSLFGQSIISSLNENLEGSDIEVVDTISYPADSPDLSSQVARAASKRPDLIVTSNYMADGILIVRHLREQNIDIPVMGLGSASMSNPALVDELGVDATAGLLDINLGVSLEKPQAQELYDAYMAEYSADGWNHHSVYSYTAVLVVADALERAGTDDPEKLIEALKDTQLTEHPLSQETISFTDVGENADAAGLMFQIDDSGEIQIVLPQEYATAELTFTPAP